MEMTAYTVFGILFALFKFQIRIPALSILNQKRRIPLINKIIYSQILESRNMPLIRIVKFLIKGGPKIFKLETGILT